MAKARNAFFMYDPRVAVPVWWAAPQQLEDTMEQQSQHDRQEQLGKGTVTPLIQPDHEEQAEENTAETKLEPGEQEQLEDDTVEPLMHPNPEKQLKENIAISWMRNIWMGITRNG